MTLIDAQFDLEQRMVGLGTRRAKSQISKTMERGEAGLTPAGIAITRRALGPLTVAIRTFLEQSLSGRAGRKHVAALLLKDVDAELAAFVSVRAALSGAVRRYTLKSTALALGERLEVELVADTFESENSALYRAVVRNARARGLSPERQARAVTLANRHFNVVEQKWTSRERLLVGTKLIELMATSLGIIQVVLLAKGKHYAHQIQLSPDIQEWFEKYNEGSALTKPLYLPTVIPPRPWVSPYIGGYHHAQFMNPTLLSRSFPGQLQALDMAHMPAVYKGINGLQETAWRINKRVLEVMKQAWERDAGLPCLPPREDTPVPPTPVEVEEDVKGGAIRKEWRKKIRAIHEKNAAGRSNRFDFARGLSIAEENAELEALYFPHRLDFRGRAYASSTTLNPQGADNVRGLLEFAEGKPLGERGLFWLGIHGANLFGNDKVSLAERFEWATDNAHAATMVAADPLNDLWWTEADKPWSFLAWCFEWGAIYGNATVGIPESEFVSHIPVALDGSCNGIQHFSAMLRDPVGGAAVNLVPADKPQDIYQRVADRVIEKLQEHVSTIDDDKTWMAENWLAFGINRKITKRAVMVLPYGGTFRSCIDYVREAVRERLKTTENPFGDDLSKAEAFLATLVWSSIGDVVIAARKAMGWLQAVARTVSKAGHPLKWTTPSGFIVHQSYREKSDRRVETKFNGSIVKFRDEEATDKLDKQRQVSAVSPNFVHSLDASAMMLTIGACLDAGIKSFAMIHDSYGTHAADTDTLAEILRGEFVRMYLQNNVLQQFLDEVTPCLTTDQVEKLPPIPKMGSLDLRKVQYSSYFFA